MADADLRLIAESIPHIVWMADADGATDYLNRQGTTYTGLAPEANFGWDWVSLVHPEDADRGRRAWEYATQTQTALRLDYRIRRFDGEYRWHAFRSLPIRDEHGVVVRWIGTATDIDDDRRSSFARRIADRESAEALTLLETVISTAPFGFGFVDRDFRMLRINETLAAVNGTTVADHLGRRVAEIAPAHWPQLEPLYRHVLDHDEAVLDIPVSNSPDRPGRGGTG